MDMTSRRTRVSGAHHHARLTTCGAIVRSAAVLLASPAAGDGAPEVNLLSASDGARIVAVSSNFGGAADDETWGAGSAVDGNPGSAWSSAGDGDEAFIEIELAGRAHLRTVEVWTRSMANGTAQTFTFTLTTDAGEVLGPFDLADAAQAYRFEIDVVASSLRFDVVTSNGGNTGLVEFAAFGTLLDQ